jgi:hypothetical protein
MNHEQHYSLWFIIPDPQHRLVEGHRLVTAEKLDIVCGIVIVIIDGEVKAELGDARQSVLVRLLD